MSFLGLCSNFVALIFSQQQRSSWLLDAYSQAPDPADQCVIASTIASAPGGTARFNWCNNQQKKLLLNFTATKTGNALSTQTRAVSRLFCFTLSQYTLKVVPGKSITIVFVTSFNAAWLTEGRISGHGYKYCLAGRHRPCNGEEHQGMYKFASKNGRGKTQWKRCQGRRVTVSWLEPFLRMDEKTSYAFCCNSKQWSAACSPESLISSLISLDVFRHTLQKCTKCFTSLVGHKRMDNSFLRLPS